MRKFIGSKLFEIGGSLSPLKFYLRVDDLPSDDESGREEKADLLGRRHFARGIASYIKEWNKHQGLSEDRSLVVGIYGEWGSGKTFLKDMILEELDLSGSISEGAQAPVIEYNPWEWAGQQKLTEGFFRTVEEHFRQFGTLPSKFAQEYKQLAKDYRVSSAKWSVLARSPRETQAAKGLALAAVSYVGFAEITLPTWLSCLALVKPVIGAIALVWLAFWLMGSVRSNISDLYAAKAEAEERTLSEVKDRIGNALRRLQANGKHVLIVVDDIDRLNAEQIRMVMQLVKANADFPNVTYLLLFERAVVEQSLADPENGIDGRDYLEKIVQRGYSIPRISEERILDIFDKRLRSAISDLPPEVEDAIKSDRLQKLIENHFPVYLRTLRNVDRLLATLPFHLTLYLDQEADSVEINVTDLFALEVLRVFDPDLFDALPAYRNQLAPNRPVDESFASQVKSALDILLSLVGAEEEYSDFSTRQDRKQAAKSLLCDLFPVLGWADSDKERFLLDTEKREDRRRVCHPEMFERYFQRILPEDALRKADVDRLIKSATELSSLKRTLNDLIKKKKIRPALISLRQRLSEIEKYYHNLVLGLFDIGDKLPSRVEHYGSRRASRLARDLVQHVLESEIERPEKRSQLLTGAFEKAESLHFCVNYVEGAGERNQEHRHAYPDSPLYSLDQAKEICARRIKDKDDTSLLADKQLRKLLFKWHKWGDPDEPKQWLKHQLAKQDHLSRVLAAFKFDVGVAQLWPYREAVRQSESQDPEYAIDLVGLSALDVLDFVEEQLDAINQSELTDEERELIKIFHTSMRHRKILESPNDFQNTDFSGLDRVKKPAYPEPPDPRPDLEGYTEAFDLIERE